MQFLIVSCSLDPESKSYLLASAAAEWLMDAGHRSTLVDLRTCALPPFDDSRVYESSDLLKVNELIRNADGVVLAAPVYNWNLGSSAKNLVEATGSNDPERCLVSPWFDQLVTFLVSGGLPHSYTAHFGLAMSLMLDFKCIINPRHVYTTGRDWKGAVLDAPSAAKLKYTLEVMVDLAGRLRGRPHDSQWEV